MDVKPFTISCLRPEKPVQTNRHGWCVEQGDRFLWRATGLNDALVQALSCLTRGTRLPAGAVPFVVEKIMMSPDEHPESGVVDENELIAACLSVPSIRRINFHFLSPTSFRAGTHDFPWPMASFVFGSLTDKWTQIGLPGDF